MDLYLEGRYKRGGDGVRFKRHEKTGVGMKGLTSNFTVLYLSVPTVCRNSTLGLKVSRKINSVNI
jgi:hypothetical protein